MIKHTILLSLILLTYLPLYLTFTLPSTTKAPLHNLLRWGTYRPHLLSAITERSKQPITVGIVYANTMLPIPEYEAFKQLVRFEVRKDIITHYTYHNGFDFSRQLIIDNPFRLKYDVIYIKNSSLAEQAGTQEWLYYVNGLQSEQKTKSAYPAQTAEPFNTFMYINLENLDESEDDFRELRILSDEDYGTSTVLQVWNSRSGKAEGFFRITPVPIEDTTAQYSNKKWSIKAVYKCMDYSTEKDVLKTIYNKLDVDIMRGFNNLDPKRCGKGQEGTRSRLFVIQLVAEKTVDVILTYSSQAVPVLTEINYLSTHTRRLSAEFDVAIQKKLPIKNLNRYRHPMIETREIQRVVISDLLGNIFYGFGNVKRQRYSDDGHEYQVESHKEEVFGVTPSRVTYKRSFLWDEGFQLLPVCSWNTTLCIELMSGWLGIEGKSDSIVKEQAYDETFNQDSSSNIEETTLRSEVEAPSLIIPVLKLVNTVRDGQKHGTPSETILEIKDFLGKALPVLKTWLASFEKRHRNGEGKKYYKWNTKDESKAGYVASGLSDYPRHTDNSKTYAHLDLHIWLLTFARSLLAAEKVVSGVSSDDILKQAESLFEGIKEFQDPADGLWKDLLVSEASGERFSNNKGYVNLFPLFFGLTGGDVKNINSIRDLIVNPDYLWSGYGVRSLALEDELFLEGNNTWNEPISIPFNFLLLRGLKKYHYDSQDLRDLYAAIRGNIARVVATNWRTSFQMWERYDSFTGMGKGAGMFNGWTALIALIYAEDY